MLPFALPLSCKADSAASSPKDAQHLEAEEQQKPFAENAKVCDTAVSNYSTSDAAQKAYATLSLAGITEAVIRPLGETRADISSLLE